MNGSATTSRRVDPDAALRSIAEATAAATGEGFFRALVRQLAHALDTHGAWVTEYLPDVQRLRGLAFWLGGQWVEGYERDIGGTPCEQVVEGRSLVHIPDNALQLYPGEEDLIATGAVSYLGVPLLDGDGRVLGHLAVLDRRPIPPDPQLLNVFQIFAARAAAEHQRLAAEARLQDRERKLARLIDSAMDAILDLDGELRVTLANPAAARLFRGTPEQLVGLPFSNLLTRAACAKLFELTDVMGATQPEGGSRPMASSPASLWVPGTLEARRLDGEAFAVEATLSRYELGSRSCLTVILRDVGDRERALDTIRSLAAEAQYLREELHSLHDPERVLGTSPAIVSVLRQIDQVAATDATVLILGETGTGKELIARAIHAASARRDKPLIRVNCAAVPASLIESEFFGHEKGAFTGATQRREGRFALAHGGTLFLDEIGELPIDLQSKLLRVLQEGEFEPVGSSKTVKVDVRVIAATNRDLLAETKRGLFREDLYYRLHVFPIRVPPLRERAQDIPMLARAFAMKAAQRMGRALAPLGDTSLERLCAYDWPGNVRELENVVERAVIAARDGRLNFDGALPELPPNQPGVPSEAREAPIRTVAEMEALERENILRALEASGWRIAGPGAAADLLAMHPSTLRSRMKALDIKRRAAHA
jgi:transcriptional regulator with GAF, ATPase, and Fis domain